MKLRELLDRTQSGALDPGDLKNIREADRQLGKVIANLPLPFDNQAQKVRFSDLPPTLRDLMKDLMGRVEKKYGPDRSKHLTADTKAFMSGVHMFSQSEIDRQFSKLLGALS